MPKYVIERELPGAGSLSKEELHAISQTSCDVLGKLGPQIQWIESYVTDDKIYCIYRAANEELVREHAKQGGFQFAEPRLTCGQVSAVEKARHLTQRKSLPYLKHRIPVSAVVTEEQIARLYISRDRIR